VEVPIIPSTKKYDALALLGDHASTRSPQLPTLTLHNSPSFPLLSPIQAIRTSPPCYPPQWPALFLDLETETLDCKTYAMVFFSNSFKNEKRPPAPNSTFSACCGDQFPRGCTTHHVHLPVGMQPYKKDHPENNNNCGDTLSKRAWGKTPHGRATSSRESCIPPRSCHWAVTPKPLPQETTNKQMTIKNPTIWSPFPRHTEQPRAAHFSLGMLRIDGNTSIRNWLATSYPPTTRLPT